MSTRIAIVFPWSARPKTAVSGMNVDLAEMLNAAEESQKKCGYRLRSPENAPCVQRNEAWQL